MSSELQEGEDAPSRKELQDLSNKIVSRTHYVGLPLVATIMIGYLALRWDWLIWVPLVLVPAMMLSIFVAPWLAGLWLGYSAGQRAR